MFIIAIALLRTKNLAEKQLGVDLALAWKCNQIEQGANYLDLENKQNKTKTKLNFYVVDIAK